MSKNNNFNEIRNETTVFEAIASDCDPIAGAKSKSFGIYHPIATQAQIDAQFATNKTYIDKNNIKRNNVDGTTFYNNTNDRYQGIRGANPNGTKKVVDFYTILTNNAGAGLNGVPFILPTAANADAEVAENQILGFMYYNTTANRIKMWNGAWVTLALVP
jgi:type IV secretory pathway TraG/TraD family ATPase VirD4